jgi:hypothetical protein
MDGWSTTILLAGGVLASIAILQVVATIKTALYLEEVVATLKRLEERLTQRHDSD